MEPFSRLSLYARAVSHATVYFDGASRGNPGPMAGGAVVTINEERRVLRGERGHGTNNEAEYLGLLLGLQDALERGATTVEVCGDSELVLRQLEGKYRVKAQNLRPHYEAAKRILTSFEHVAFRWVPRAENAAADRAANEALDR